MTRVAAERLDPSGYDHEITIPVLFGDLDANGHVNNVTMGRFFEHARVMANARLREIEPGLRFLVARVTIDYLAEGRFGHPFVVRSRVAAVGTTSMRLEQAAWQEQHCVSVCEAVLVGHVDGTPVPLPPSIRAVAMGG